MDVLIIEDNAEIASNIGEYLEMKGHISDYAPNGIIGLKLATENNYDAIILDLMLPGLDGLSVCKRYQQQQVKHAPIIMLTAKDTTEDIVAGLSAGADDYLVKPFSLPELLARLEVLTRRFQTPQTPQLEIHDLVLNLDTHEVSRGGKVVPMKPTTARILEYLMRNSHRVVPRAEIEKTIWADDPPNGDPLRAHVYNIRRAVDHGFDISLVHTIHGVGYRIYKSDDSVT